MDASTDKKIIEKVDNLFWMASINRYVEIITIKAGTNSSIEFHEPLPCPVCGKEKVRTVRPGRERKVRYECSFCDWHGELE
jgi:predicted RNA-binding Zn-ribbon protein involved in translation (DUF1610 family)